MESNTNNISSAGLHGLDAGQRRSETSEEVDIRQGQNALGSLSLSTGLTPSHNRARSYYYHIVMSRSGIQNGSTMWQILFIT